MRLEQSNYLEQWFWGNLDHLQEDISVGQFAFLPRRFPVDPSNWMNLGLVFNTQTLLATDCPIIARWHLMDQKVKVCFQTDVTQWTEGDMVNRGELCNFWRTSAARNEAAWKQLNSEQHVHVVVITPKHPEL